MSSVTKPTVFLIPGVSHTPAHFSALTHQLSALGYPATSVSLPSVDPKAPFEASLANDCAHVRAELEAVLDAGKDVILVAHSYGGLPGSVAARGLMKTEREAAGRKGGILGQAYIAAFLAPEGVSLLQAFGGKHAPWVVLDEERGVLTANDPKAVFFADAEDDVANAAVAELRPSSMASVATPCPASGIADLAVEGKRVYIVCTNDAGVPPPAQEMIVQGTGLKWDVKKFESGHCPMVSQPKALASLLIEVAEEFGR